LATGSIVNSVSYKDTGVILSVTPRVNQSGRVLLDIDQEVSNVSQTTSSSINSPTIQQRRIKTTVVVNDSETLALGGLIQDNKTITRNQVPVAGDIPLIGNLFKQKTDTVAKTELIVLITPRVIRDASQAREVTEEYRRKIDILLPKSRPRRGIQQAIERTLE
jgi:general secretion pathway protein D